MLKFWEKKNNEDNLHIKLRKITLQKFISAVLFVSIKYHIYVTKYIKEIKMSVNIFKRLWNILYLYIINNNGISTMTYKILFNKIKINKIINYLIIFTIKPREKKISFKENTKKS